MSDLSQRVESFKKASPRRLASFGIEPDDPRPLALGRHRTLLGCGGTYAYLSMCAGEWRPEVNDAFLKAALRSGKRLVVLLERDPDAPLSPGDVPRSCELAVEVAQLLDAGCRFTRSEAQPHAAAGITVVDVVPPPDGHSTTGQRGCWDVTA